MARAPAREIAPHPRDPAPERRPELPPPPELAGEDGIGQDGEESPGPPLAHEDEVDERAESSSSSVSDVEPRIAEIVYAVASQVQPAVRLRSQAPRARTENCLAPELAVEARV
jgi:hypothetical protein